jgi:hypothetical protein
LREVGKANEDTELVKKYASHADAQVQDECLHTLISFDAGDLESIIIKGLNNPDDKLRWRAVTSLGKLRTLSRDAVVQILQIIISDPPDDESEAAAHSRKIVQLIQAVGGLNNFPAPDRLEDALLKVIQKSINSSKGLITRLKLQNPKTDQTPILVAAFGALGKVGSAKSNAFLAKCGKGKSAIALEAQKALKSIEARHLKSATTRAAS